MVTKGYRTMRDASGLYVVYGEMPGHINPGTCESYWIVPGTASEDRAPPIRGEADQFGGPRLYG